MPALVWSAHRLQSCQQVVDNVKKKLLRQSITHLTQILLSLFALVVEHVSFVKQTCSDLQ